MWGVTCAHCTRGVQSRQRRRISEAVGPNHSRQNDITTNGGRPPRPHSRHSPHLHSLISSRPFHPGCAEDRYGDTYLLKRSHSSTPHGPPSLVPLPQFLVILVQGENMAFGDFNAHHPSWFSSTGDDRTASRGEALDGAINSSQLAVANQDLPTHLPSRYHPS